MKYSYWVEGSTTPYVIEARGVSFDGSFVSFWDGPLWNAPALIKAVTGVLRVEPTTPQDTVEPEPDDRPTLNLKTIKTHLGQLANNAASGTEALRHYRIDVPALIAEVEVLRDRQRR